MTMLKKQVIQAMDIEAMEKNDRVHFMNSVIGFKNPVLIGTISKNKIENVAIFGSIIHIGSNPPLIGFISRPDIVPRNTLHNIRDTGYYTINHIHSDIVKQAHQTSAKYHEDVSEFKECGLHPYYISEFTAPFVQESYIQIGLSLHEIIPIPSNNTHLVIGKVVRVQLPNQIISSDGYVNIERAGTLVCSGNDTYHQTHMIKTYSYAKPNKPVQEIRRTYDI